MNTKAVLALGLGAMILSGCAGSYSSDDGDKEPSKSSGKMGDLQDLRSPAERRLDDTSGLRNTIEKRTSARNISLGQVSW
jgi:PBP1b-binding outer membrane lipoprotein LpoB